MPLQAPINIRPTPIEPTAPQRFTYYSIGQDLIALGKGFSGIGWYPVISKDFILSKSGPAALSAPGNLA